MATVLGSFSPLPTVEDCFYVALEAARIARKFSTPVFILSDGSLATRIEAFDEPDLKSLLQDPHPDLTPRSSGYKPYSLEGITHHAPPGTRMVDGKYPVVTGLEHDEMGHPTGRPSLHMAMTAKRRRKLQELAAEIPLPEVYGDAQGDTLLIGWGSTFGPIREAVDRVRESRNGVSSYPPAALASPSKWARTRLCPLQSNRCRRNERPGSLWIRPISDGPAGPFLRPENSKPDQNRRSNVSD